LKCSKHTLTRDVFAAVSLAARESPTMRVNTNAAIVLLSDYEKQK
jgi:hypothetical protein